jgi:ribonucleoside-diphosphate reductase alpha chain
MIAWESMEALCENVTIFSEIRNRADNASEKLAALFGEPEVLKGYGRRNTTTLAIAPTTSSSFILGQVSPSIEPLNSNYFVKNLAKGQFTYRNPKLQEVLESKGKNDKATWKSILIHGGSVLHLDFLSEHEKDVFKTFAELSQKEVVVHAAQRQAYIDQGQSLNLMIPAGTKPKEINELMIFAWQQGVKSLYYQRSSNPSQDLARSILTCSSCES